MVEVFLRICEPCMRGHHYACEDVNMYSHPIGWHACGCEEGSCKTPEDA